MKAKLFLSVVIATVFAFHADPMFADHDALKPFDAKSLPALQWAHKGKPFILAFWSVGCPPCVEELGDWGKWQRSNPTVPIFLVSTDANQDRAAVNALLTQHDLASVATYIFSDTHVERVRWSIDRRWRGELPRTYFFDANHRSEGFSGKLDHNKISAWMKIQTQQPRPE